jgi:hypothetical protein
MITFQPFEWKSEPPEDIPFQQSQAIKGIRFLGRCSDYRAGDTWYPSWASDDVLYSPWTDGTTEGVESMSEAYRIYEDGTIEPRQATTAHAKLIGDDPLHLRIVHIGLHQTDPYPYGGRYPCGSLVYNGIWYYGTYCLSPYGTTKYGNTVYNWPWLGPFVGFHISYILEADEITGPWRLVTYYEEFWGTSLFSELPIQVFQEVELEVDFDGLPNHS